MLERQFGRPEHVIKVLVKRIEEVQGPHQNKPATVRLLEKRNSIRKSNLGNFAELIENDMHLACKMDSACRQGYI